MSDTLCLGGSLFCTDFAEYTNCASVFAPNGRGVALCGARETAAFAAGTKRKGHLRFARRLLNLVSALCAD